MAYNANVPNPDISPDLFPAECSENFTRLQKIIGGDHQFNASLLTPDTDGYHKNIHMMPQDGTSTPTSVNGYGQLYGTTTSPNQVNLRYLQGGSSVVKSLTDYAPSVAITFTGLTAANASIPTGPVDPSYIYSSFNVLELYKIAEGRYRIAYSSALKNAYYTWIFSGTGFSSGQPSPIRSTVYNPNIVGYEAWSAAQICFEIREQTTNNYKDPKQFSVLILGG